MVKGNKSDYLKDPIKPIEPTADMTVGDLVEAFEHTSYQSRNLARCFNAYRNMISAPDRPTVFLGFAGAMVPAGMKKVIISMIKNKLIDVLVSTGANLYHDWHEARGNRHYIGSQQCNDTELREMFIDRIYDTFADEEKFRESDNAIKNIADKLEPIAYSSREFLEKMGQAVKGTDSILATAAENGLPIFCPALNDSSIGIAITKHYYECLKANRKPITIDPIKDNWEIAQIKLKSKSTGVVYVGGGTPKNYIQQTEVMLEVIGLQTIGHRYAIQLTTDDPKWGGLSGCTFEEAQSWGKITKDAKMATAYIDATVALPILVTALIQKCSDIIAKRRRLKLTWDKAELKSIQQV
jgi:deoxyhypusine synthase